MLRGTIRDHVTQQRRPFLRFFACEEDLSHRAAGRATARSRGVGQGAVHHHRCDCGRVVLFHLSLIRKSRECVGSQAPFLRFRIPD